TSEWGPMAGNEFRWGLSSPYPDPTFRLVSSGPDPWVKFLPVSSCTSPVPKASSLARHWSDCSQGSSIPLQHLLRHPRLPISPGSPPLLGLLSEPSVRVQEWTCRALLLRRTINSGRRGWKKLPF